MNNIIPRLTEYENDIKLLKNAILVLEKNFSKIKSDSIDTYTQTNRDESNIKNESKKKEKKKPKKKNKKQEQNTVYKKSSITLSNNNNIRIFFNINSSNDNSNDNSNDDKILISELNMKLNEYLIEKNLIKDKKVYLNKELKKLLKTNKRIIELDEILNVIIKLNN